MTCLWPGFGSPCLTAAPGRSARLIPPYSATTSQAFRIQNRFVLSYFQCCHIFSDMLVLGEGVNLIPHFSSWNLRFNYLSLSCQKSSMFTSFTRNNKLSGAARHLSLTHDDYGEHRKLSQCTREQTSKDSLLTLLPVVDFFISFSVWQTLQ